jgi:uncharacterized protein YlxW (UPF0749 family)
MKRLNKKGIAFDVINAGMISFLSFMLITLLVILMVSVVKNTSIVTGDSNATAAMNNLQSAANLPPQFAQIIVIVVIIVGILGMLAMIGYGAYQKMRR